MIVTRRQVCEIITNSLNNDIPLDNEELEAVINGVNADIQIRDWLLGLPNTWSLEDGIKLMQHLAIHAPAEDLAPFVTIQAVYQAELGDKEKANYLLDYALKLSPDYSLAGLVKTVLLKGLDGSMFKSMRAELHPRVVEECYGENGNTVITEDGKLHESNI